MMLNQGDYIRSLRWPWVIKRIEYLSNEGYFWSFADLPSGENNLYHSKNSTYPDLGKEYIKVPLADLESAQREIKGFMRWCLGHTSKSQWEDYLENGKCVASREAL